MMPWDFMVTLLLLVAVIPIVFPVFVVWHLDEIDDIYAAIQGAWNRRSARGEGIKTVAEDHAAVSGAVAQERPAEKELVGTKR